MANSGRFPDNPANRSICPAYQSTTRADFMAKQRDGGVPEHPVVRTYFLDHSDNLRAIAPLEVPEAVGQGAADNASADPRREAWIEICDSRHRFQARLRPAGRERRRRRLLELFDARQQKPLAALLDFADLFR